MQRDMQSYWGVESLRRSPRVALQGIPEASKDFLEQVGLPVIHDSRFHFEPEVAPFQLIDEANGYRKIGLYDSQPICVREGDGCVYWYDEIHRVAKFMNSSVETFSICLTVYQQMLVKARATEQAQRKTLVRQAEEQMRSIDPRAFAEEEFYWPVVFEEIGYELS